MDENKEEINPQEPTKSQKHPLGNRLDVRVSVEGELAKLNSDQKNKMDDDTKVQVARSLTAHKIMIDRARRTADKGNYDSLTNLPNRRRFDIDLKKAVDDVNSRTDIVSYSGGEEPGDYVLMMDLDKFKHVNDTYGHPKGDSILKLVAHINYNFPIRDDEPIYRFGGDEYAQILKGIKRNDLFTVANRYRKNMERMSGDILKLPGSSDEETQTSDNVGMSFGFARIEPGMAPSQVFELADSALMQVKRTERGNVMINENINGKREINPLNGAAELETAA